VASRNLRPRDSASAFDESKAASDVLRERRERTRPPLARRGATLPGPPPCFNFRLCRDRAVLEKGGRSLCRGCAASVNGREYPLRKPSHEALYPSGLDCAQATDMIECLPHGLQRK
jgi:hypothetical protein